MNGNCVNETLIELGARLTELAVKGTASTISKKMAQSQNLLI